VFPQDFEIDQLIDSFDELKTIVDPKSQYVTNAANAVGRGWDDASSPPPSAPRRLGTRTPTAFRPRPGLRSRPTTRSPQQLRSSSASGLTVAKLIEAKRIFRHNHVDLEVERGITLVIGSKQESDLLNQVAGRVSPSSTTSLSWWTVKLTRFLGFDIVMSERPGVDRISNVRPVGHRLREVRASISASGRTRPTASRPNQRPVGRALRPLHLRILLRRDAPGARPLAKRQQPIWQAAGLTVDPGGFFDVVATATATVNTGARMGVEVVLSAEG
jgi:hypothetical protein